MVANAAIRDFLGDRLIQYDNRSDWLTGRDVNFRIGGSDVAKILGVSPYGSPWDVWARKKMNVQRDYSPEQLAIFARGRRWEGRVLEDYAEETSIKVEAADDLLVLHPEEAWAVGSPDGFARDASVSTFLDKCLGGVEAKTDRERKLWGESGQVIERWEDGAESIVRPDYALQVYWYLEVTGLEWWDVAVAIPRGFDFPELRHFRLHRDPVIQGLILDKVGQWRERFLVGDDEPDPDGSEAAKAALLARFPGRGDKVVREALPHERDLLVELAAVKAEEKELERRKAKLSQQIQAAIGDDYGITLGAAKALWIPTKGRAGFDSKALKREHPELASKYETRGKGYRSLRLYGFND